MFQDKSIRLSLICLLAMTVGSGVQATCTECPALSSATTILCGNDKCYIVASGCKLEAKISGNPKIRGNHPAKPLPLTQPGEKPVCSYGIQGGQTINFTVEENR